MNPFESCTIGTHRWLVRPGCRDRLLCPGGLRLEEWIRDGRAALVKQSAQRRIYLVRLDGLTVYLKHNHVIDARAWFRELLRPAKAVIEFDAARELARRGVPTFEPLAVGVSAVPLRPADSFLLTRALEQTIPLSQLLEVPLDPAARRRLADALGRFMACLHRAGVRHDDLHPGNVLVRLRGDGGFDPFLIDLHAVRLGPESGLSWPAARDNLILLNRWFSLRSSRSDRRRFWRAYASPSPPGSEPQLRDLETLTGDSNAALWRSRDRRCLATNRYYRRVHAPGVSGMAVRDLDPDEIRRLLADPEAVLADPDTRVLKDSRSSTVVRTSLTVGGVRTEVVWKRFNVVSAADPWKGFFRRSAAARSWVFGHGVRERCLPTPRPLLLLQRRAGGLTREEYLITEYVPGAIDLGRWMRTLERLDVTARQRSLRPAIDQLARLVRELHRRRLAHRDLKASNILVRAAPAPAGACDFGPFELIDLVGVRRYVRPGRHRLIQNLARLNASFLNSPVLTRSDRVRFLRVYFQWGLVGKAGGRSGPGGWKGWWREIQTATSRKAARNQRLGRPLA